MSDNAAGVIVLGIFFGSISLPVTVGLLVPLLRNGQANRHERKMAKIKAGRP